MQLKLAELFVFRADTEYLVFRYRMTSGDY